MKKTYFTTLLAFGLLSFTSISLHADELSGFSFVSSENNYWQINTVSADQIPTGTPKIIIDSNDTSQTFKGWGTCFNELGWDALNLLTQTEQELIMKNLSAPEGDMKFTIGRFSVGANDYARDWYSLNETDGDFEMNHFNLDRDKTTIIPYIHFAQKYNPDMTFWGSPWSPPSWMKTNKHYANRSGANNGLAVDKQVPVYFNDQFIQEPRYLQAYTLYFSKMIDAFKAEGIPVTTLMYQNEAYSFTVYPSCSWTAQGTRDFYVKYLGPYFAKHHPDVELVMGTMNTGSLDVYEEILKDPELKKYIRGIGFQWEGGRQIAEVRRRYPDYELEQTESECGHGSFDWAAGQHTFNLINHFLANGCTRYTFWNAILKDNGSSSWGWLQNALIQVNSSNNTYTLTPEYYAAKHYTHFIQPGSVVLNGSSANDLVLAVKRPDNSIVIVAGNHEEKEKSVSMQIDGKYFKATLPARSFASYIFADQFTQLSMLIDQAQAIHFTDLTSVYAQKLNSALEIARSLNENSDSDLINESSVDLRDIINEINLSASVKSELSDLIEKCNNLLSLNYDGKESFDESIYKATDILKSSLSDLNDLNSAILSLKDALSDYCFSSQASVESPVDVTMLISNPSFSQSGSAGWIINNDASRGDFRAANIAGRSCWNNWSDNFNSMEIYQELEGLAPGLYSVSSYSMCGIGEITNQHTFASTGYGDSKSEIKIVDNAWGQASGWEKQQTSKVLVGKDGKLKIGYSSNSGGGSNGWFCVTDFALTYYGNDELSVKEMFESKKHEAISLLSELKFHSYKSKLSDLIDKAETVTLYNDIVLLLGELNQLIKEASISNLVYENYYEELLPSVQQFINDNLDQLISQSALTSFVEHQREILDSPEASVYDIRQCADMLEASLPYFLINNSAAYFANLDIYDNCKSSELLSLLDDQVSQLQEISDPSIFSDLRRTLENEIVSLRLTQQPGYDSDFSFVIKNNDASGTLFDGVPEGWSVSITNGDGVIKSDRHYSGDLFNPYFDSYSSTKGSLYFTGTQNLHSIPNGVYELSCYGRSNARGAYLVAQTDNNIYMQEFPVGTSGGETGGQVWSEAAEGSSARNVNSGKGHGWSEIVIPGIIVDNNKLTIGFTNDKYLTGDSFDGHWFSTDDFGLKYKSADYLDIEETESEDSSIKVYVENGIIKVLTDSPYTIYDARGYKINSAGDNPASFYIVRTINESVKVVVP